MWQMLIEYCSTFSIEALPQPQDDHVIFEYENYLLISELHFILLQLFFAELFEQYAIMIIVFEYFEHD